jgi:hypothetical protein
MSILAAIRREEKKVKKQLSKLQNDLVGLQSAAKALGKTASRDITRAKKGVLSAKGRAKISKARASTRLREATPALMNSGNDWQHYPSEERSKVQSSCLPRRSPGFLSPSQESSCECTRR